MLSMAGYTKLFNSILASTIWREDDKTRLVWITLLALADKDGVAASSIPGLADMAHVSLEDCEAALAKLMAPDKYSRTQENDGRRIQPVDGGWFLLNHGKYRAKMSADERREYFRNKQAEYRKREKVSTNVNTSKTLSKTVKDSPSHVEQVTHSEAEAEAKAEAYPQVQKKAEGGGIVFNTIKKGIENMYGRTSGLTLFEQDELRGICRRAGVSSEWLKITNFRESLPDKRMFPQTIPKLLQMWQETLDRANVPKAKTINKFTGKVENPDWLLDQQIKDLTKGL